MEDSIDNDDPSYRTYYMMNWDAVKQSPSWVTCVACGRAMLKVDPVRNKAGVAFEGRVCHSCKVLFWVRKDG
jgi:hypothetical protein